MKIRCGWCKKDMGTKEPEDDTQETTGICETCLELLRLEARRYGVIEWDEIRKEGEDETL